MWEKVTESLYLLKTEEKWLSNSAMMKDSKSHYRGFEEGWMKRFATIPDTNSIASF